MLWILETDKLEELGSEESPHGVGEAREFVVLWTSLLPKLWLLSLLEIRVGDGMGAKKALKSNQLHPMLELWEELSCFRPEKCAGSRERPRALREWYTPTFQVRQLVKGTWPMGWRGFGLWSFEAPEGCCYSNRVVPPISFSCIHPSLPLEP